MYDLWNENGKCPPEPMRIATTPITDLNAQDGVDFKDFAEFAGFFLSDCNDDDLCDRCNFDDLGGIDLADFRLFAQSWLWGK